MSNQKSSRRRSARLLRAQLKRHIAAAPIVARHLVKQFVKAIDTKLGDFAISLSLKQARELAERERQRRENRKQWLTVDEYRLVDVLASLIVPSDQEGPGAKEADAVGTIDRLLVGSQCRQEVYASGLLSLDEWARREHGRIFVQLTHEQKINLLKRIERSAEGFSNSASLISKFKNRIIVLYNKWNGLFAAGEFMPTLVQDVKRAFYTNQVCWDWLDYDGPPMPHGYPDLFQKRSQSEPPRAKIKRVSVGLPFQGDHDYRRAASGKE